MGPVIKTSIVKMVPISAAACPILSYLRSFLTKYIIPLNITMKYARKPDHAIGTCR